MFPPSNPLNQDISRAPVDPSSARYIASIGLGGHLHPDFGTNPVLRHPLHGRRRRPGRRCPSTSPNTAKNPIPALPDPARTRPIEGAGEAKATSHVLVLQRGSCRLYELYSARRSTARGWEAGSGAVFNLRSNALRPEGWTSADAAGLPIFPLLARYPEVRAGASTTRCASPSRAPSAATSTPPPTSPRAARIPACHRWACACGCSARYSLAGFHGESLVVLRALKRYGLIVADNGSLVVHHGRSRPALERRQTSNRSSACPGSAFEAVRSGDDPPALAAGAWARAGAASGGGVAEGLGCLLAGGAAGGACWRTGLR